LEKESDKKNKINIERGYEMKYSGNELKYIEEVMKLNKTSSTIGNFTQRLEKEFAKKFNAKYGVAMNSGTAVLHAALVALDVRPGDEVITPALTVFMDTSSIIHCNAIPVYVDINPNTYNIDSEDVIKKITPKTKVIIGVSLYGLECDVNALEKIAQQYDLGLIIDNAQHMGMCRGHITTYSFEDSKHLSCGEGGIALTNSKYYAERMRKLSNHGFQNSLADEGRTKLNLEVFQNPNYKRHTSIGWNYRLSEFSSAIALAQLERLDEFVEMRKRIWNDYNYIVNDFELDFIKNNNVVNNNFNSCWSFVCLCYRWNEFRKIYIDLGGDGFYGAWSVPYLEPAIQNRIFVRNNPYIYENIYYNKGICKNAEKIQPYIMQFKTNYLNFEEAKKNIKILENTLTRAAREINV